MTKTWIWIALGALAVTPACASGEQEVAGDELDLSAEEGALRPDDITPDDEVALRLMDRGITLFDSAENASAAADLVIERQLDLYQRARGGDAEALEAAAAGEHYHVVDWAATRVTLAIGHGECEPQGPLLGQGAGFIMHNSGAGFSCNGEWMVSGRLPNDPPERYRYIKIRSLDGH